MPSLRPSISKNRPCAIVIGAGIGGLAAAARLSNSGYAVTVFERHATPGGKMRCLPSIAGPVDAGPTVLTLRSVFDDLFHEVGERLEDHVELSPQNIIARHFWPDGNKLDLHANEAESIESIREFAGDCAAKEFRAFNSRTRRLFEAFDRPVMRSARPSISGLLHRLIRQPGLVRDMAVGRTMAQDLSKNFTDPRLVQLFGRYSTYVGGSPYGAPALLSLIWQAEAGGVWTVEGGLSKLAKAIADVAEARGAKMHFSTDVAGIEVSGGRVRGVDLADGKRYAADRIVFNGDPRALATGALGTPTTAVAAETLKTPRSLSADVWAFAARASGPDLVHHNVFFSGDPEAEFAALERGERNASTTLYVCAMDRSDDGSSSNLERFEIIGNAPSLEQQTKTEEVTECQDRIFGTLKSFGLEFYPIPEATALTTPTDFNKLFPQTAGSLYGQSPHGLMSVFRRPTARTAIRGLYLAGGGAHPGAGVPMAALSGRHAAEAILSDRTLTSTSRRTATRGGTSTASTTTAAAPSVSSHS